MKLLTVATLSIGLLGLSDMIRAENAAGQSYYGTVNVGYTHAYGPPGYPSVPGQPSIVLVSPFNTTPIAFNALKNMILPDTNGVTSLSSLPPPAMGSFDFKTIASQQVYFGEWSNSGVDNDPTRVVYYSGETTGRVLPSTSVTYAVQGINNYSGTNLLTGELTASFGTAAPALTGTLSNNSLKIQLSAPIATADASFSGYAIVRNSSTQSLLSSGTTQGSFFGAGTTASIAGITKFTNRNYDTAFGGVVK